MKSIKTILISALVLGATAISFAQGQGRGMRMMGGGAGQSAVMLLGRNDVKKDLKLTDEQVSKLEALQQKMQGEMQAMFQGGGGGDREAMQKKMQEMMATAEKEAMAVLDDKQKPRLTEIQLQFLGNRAITVAKFQKPLNVTEAQLAKIKELQTKSREAMASLREKMQSGELSREELMDIMKKNNDAMDVELGKLMTDEQKASLKKMQGAKFEKDPDEGGTR